MTARLAWTYNRDGTEESADYRGFTIRAVRDHHPENPFEAWDTEPPTLVYQGRRDGFTDYADGVLTDPLAAISDSKLQRAWRQVAAALSITPEDYKRERDERRQQYGDTAAETRRELAEVALDDARHGNGSDYLETLAALWRIAGCEAVTWTSRGYSQGDWAEGLSVATPAWVKLTGAPKSLHVRQLEYAGNLWGFWAWGDVYGHVIEESGEEVDGEGSSVWGFYGENHAESGLEESARDAVDSIIRARCGRRQAKAAELIRARVPLALRPAILDRAEAGQ